VRLLLVHIDLKIACTTDTQALEMPTNTINVSLTSLSLSLSVSLPRFKSVHCLLYPDTLWCPSQVAF